MLLTLILMDENGLWAIQEESIYCKIQIALGTYSQLYCNEKRALPKHALSRWYPNK